MSHLNNAQWWALLRVLYKEEFEIQISSGIFQGSLVYQSEFWQETDGTLEQDSWGNLNKGLMYL